LAAALDLASEGQPDSNPGRVRFKVGAAVRVRADAEGMKGTRFRKPHLRTPGYVFGRVGRVERHCGAFPDPSFLAFRGAVARRGDSAGNDPPKQHLYRVRSGYRFAKREAKKKANELYHT